MQEEAIEKFDPSLHCNHSVESLPLLTKLATRLGPDGYKVIGVFVNSGTVEQVKYLHWFSK